MTGHSYIVYGPLLCGATTFMYEGAPTYPYPNRWWSLVVREQELGAYAVGAGNEHRIVHVLGGGDREQTAEPPDVADHFSAVGRANGLADRIDRASTLGRVDARVAVRYRLPSPVIVRHRSPP